MVTAKKDLLTDQAISLIVSKSDEKTKITNFGLWMWF